MYGIISSAVVLGIILVAIIKEYRLKDFYGRPIHLTEKDKRWKKYLIGGSIFGMGWALTGACPGPIFVLLGQGYTVMLIVIAGALAGTTLLRAPARPVASVNFGYYCLAIAAIILSASGCWKFVKPPSQVSIYEIPSL